MSEYAKSLQDLIGSCDQLTHPSNVTFPKIPHEMVERERAGQVSVTSCYLVTPILLQMCRRMIVATTFISNNKEIINK